MVPSPASPSSPSSESPKKIVFRPMPPTSPAGNTAARAHRREFLRQQQMAKQQQQQQHHQQHHHQQQPPSLLSEPRRSPTKPMVSGIPVKSPSTSPVKVVYSGTAIPTKQRSTSAITQQQPPPLMRHPILATTSPATDNFSTSIHALPLSKPVPTVGSVSSVTSLISVLATPSFSNASTTSLVSSLSLGRSAGHECFHRSSHQGLASSSQPIPIPSRIPKRSAQRTHVLSMVDEWEHKATIRKVSSSLPTTTSSVSLLMRELSLSTSGKKTTYVYPAVNTTVCLDSAAIEKTRKMATDVVKSVVAEEASSNIATPLPETIVFRKSLAKPTWDPSASTNMLLSKTDPMRRFIDTSPILQGLGCEPIGDTCMVVVCDQRTYDDSLW